MFASSVRRVEQSKRFCVFFARACFYTASVIRDRYEASGTASRVRCALKAEANLLQSI